MAARVLAVDDDPQLVMLTVRYLGNYGYDARGLSDPREAPDYIRSFSPEVCILDIQMPFVSGSDLLDDIKSISPHTEVILLTGVNDTVLAVDLMKRGAAADSFEAHRAQTNGCCGGKGSEASPIGS